jgi:hypothetical protein
VKKRKRTSKITAPKSAHELLIEYCKGTDEWPESWAASDRDIPIGKQLVEEFTPFLLDRIQKGRAKSTIKIYAGYLWVLGGELIRQINNYEEERKLPSKQLILNYVDASGGPLWRHARDGLDHRRYDSVCKGLYKFMTNQM